MRLTLSLPPDSAPCTVKVAGNAYQHASATRNVTPEKTEVIVLPLAESFGWYDLTLTIEGAPQFTRRYAGRVETGSPLRSDPVMGERA